MEWKNVLGNTDMIRTEGALIPVYRLSDETVVLIDSGAEEEPELLPELEKRGLKVRAIVCTHLHPDHIANNEAILARDGAEVFAARAEVEDSEQTFSLLRRTAEQLGIPCPEPNHPITVMEGERVVIDGAAFALIPTPGHTRGHRAVVTPDGVCCLGDALITEDRLRLSRLPYFEDVDQALESMELLRQTQWPVYLVAHNGPVLREELDRLVDINVQKELELYDALRGAVSGPMGVEEAITRFMESLGLRPRAVESFLMRHTAQVRVRALIHAGEYREEGGVVCPR